MATALRQKRRVDFVLMAGGEQNECARLYTFVLIKSRRERRTRHAASERGVDGVTNAAVVVYGPFNPKQRLCRVTPSAL